MDFKEGDVFNYRYTPATIERFRGVDPYWTSDQRCVFHGGRLIDTYWGFPPRHMGSDSRTVKPEEAELTFVCNVNDCRPIREYEALHYAEADVFNLSYNKGCHRKLMVPKDAKPNGERILDEVRKKESSVRASLDHAVRTLQDLAVLRSNVERGDLTRLPWWSKE